MIEIVEQCLRAANGKGRDDEIAAAVHRVVDDLEQCAFLVVDLMQPVAVRRFDQYEIRPLDVRRVLDDWLVGLAEVAGEDELRVLALLVDEDFQECRAKDMAGIAENHAQMLGELEFLVVRHGREMLECLRGIIEVVERLDGFIAAAASLAVLEFRIGFLDVGGVRQHDLREVARRFRRVDRALKPSCTSFGTRPQWSTCAWVRSTPSISPGLNENPS